MAGAFRESHSCAPELLIHSNQSPLASTRAAPVAMLPRPVCRRRWVETSTGSHALVVEDLTELVLDRHEVGLVAHDLFDVLVGGGGLVDQPFGAPAQPDAPLHRRRQLVERDLLARGGSGEAAAGAVSARVVRQGIAEPSHDER